MDSFAQAHVDLGVGPEAAVRAIENVISGNKHKLDESSLSEGIVRFTTKKTLFTWELSGEARVTSQGNGSRVEITLDNAPGRPSALLDKKKNQKAAQKLVDQITAEIG